MPDNEELTEDQKIQLLGADIKLHMSLVMSIGWIVGNVRPNLKFSHHILAKRLSAPRIWGMYVAVWVMDHLILTKNWPLVLGDKTVDPEVFSDSSFATMKGRRIVASHCLRTGPLSGTIFANVQTIKVAIKSLFEGETYGASDGQDTSIYARRVIEELKYPTEDSRKVFVDRHRS